LPQEINFWRTWRASICGLQKSPHKLFFMFIRADRHRFSPVVSQKRTSICLFLCYYNFCWLPGKMRISPAMAAGVTDKLWSFADLMAEFDARG
jgi:hypothetical protein